MRKMLSLLLCVLLALALSVTALAAEDAHYPVTVTTYNYAKEPVEMTFAARPERVICTNQTQTEMLLYLGLDDVIAGCAYLDGAVREDLKDAYDALVAAGKELTVTGYPDKEVVLALEPDFIFGWRSAFADTALGDVGEWQARGVNTLILSCSNNTAPVCDIDAVLNDFAAIGAIFDIEDVTDAYIADARSLMDGISAHVAQLEAPLNVLVIEPMGEGEWYAWSRGSLTGSLVEAAGAVNLSEEGGTLSVENIVNFNPDAIIVDYMGGRSGDADEVRAAADAAIASLTGESALAEVPAVKDGRIMAVNLTDVYGGGIRMVPSVQAIYDFLYGDTAA